MIKGRKTLVKFILLFLVLSVLVSRSYKNVLSNKAHQEEKKVLGKVLTPTTTPTSTLTPTLTPAPTNIPTPTNSSTPTQEIKKERMAETHNSSASELNLAMNNYRSARGLSVLNTSDVLCGIAKNRANELLALGKLDNHDGFTKYWQTQSIYKGMAEITHWASFAESGVQIIENGWDKSPGHKAEMNDPKWQEGCGGISGYFAVFEFGIK